MSPASNPTPSDEWSRTVAQRWLAFGDEVRRRLGAGEALGPADRAGVEERLGGRDLSSALVHRGPFGARVAEALGAEAMTVGGHVIGGTAALDATTPRGAALLGHELVHTQQQAAGGDGATHLQREVDDAPTQEFVARAVESNILADVPARPRPAVDVEKLAERVYRRMLDQAVAERERSGLLGARADW